MAQSTIATKFGTTTLLGSHLGLSSLLPVPFGSKKEFTLNNHFNIFPNEEITTMPKLRYVGVGINGCYNVDDTILSHAYNPSRLNMNLFSLIPIRCRPIDEDLSDAERAYYRLRQRKVLQDGNEYFLYYLKVLEFSDSIKFKKTNALTGAEEPYELNSENLEPKPEKPNSSSLIETSSSAIVAYCESNLTIEASEILEYINIAYGDPAYAKISELGYFTGVDKQVSGLTGQNVPMNYTEAIYTTLYHHTTWIGTPLTDSSMAIDATIEICSDGSITTK